MNTLRLAGVVICAMSAASAADKPNLSGNWKMDANKSDFGSAPPPDSFIRKIDQNEPALVFIDEQTSALGNEKAARKYTTDGKETSYQWMGGEVKSAAHWENTTLVIIGKVNAGGTDLLVTSAITISEDGKTLTENDRITASGNDVAAFKIVLVKE